MIQLQRVTKRFGPDSPPAVDDVSLHVRRGQLLVLLGESGCGKTTTLKMVNRLIEPSGGLIEVDGQNIADVDPIALRRRIGYVFQGVGLFPHMSIAQNVAIVPRLLGQDPTQIEARVVELLDLVGLPRADFGDRLPRALSGGQRQRIGVARALAAKPRIMLMDEPFGALDPLTRDALQEEYLTIHRQLELTSIMVTHDMTEALLMADRIAVMKEGKLLQVGTPHQMMTEPEHDYVRQLMAAPKRQADRLEAIAGTAGDA